MAGETVGDEEVLLRRIPPIPPFFDPPDRISTANFKLDRRRRELGLSVYRESTIGPDQILSLPDAISGSFLVAATAGEVRSLKNAVGEPLFLDVVAADEDGKNPGHAEIRGPAPGKLTASASKALRDLFRRIDKP